MKRRIDYTARAFASGDQITQGDSGILAEAAAALGRDTHGFPFASESYSLGAEPGWTGPHAWGGKGWGIYKTEDGKWDVFRVDDCHEELKWEDTIIVTRSRRLARRIVKSRNAWMARRHK